MADGYTEALAWIDPALELAGALRDSPTRIHLLYLRGGVHCMLLRYRVGVEDYWNCLLLLRARTERTGQSDISLELDVVARLAGFKFFLGDYEAAASLLETSRRLIERTPNPGISAGTAAWRTALLLRWRGQPERALPHALAAYHAYAPTDRREATGRIQAVVAEIALDIANTCSPDGLSARYDEYVDMATRFAENALHFAQAAADAPGHGLAVLAAMRCSAARGENFDRVHVIESVLRSAESLHDPALLGQAYTAMGSEFDLLECEALAANCYRQALGVLAGTDVPALGIWAWRGLDPDAGPFAFC
ncbi:MAG: hypothetical protein IVW57_07400 [Ktedonobacterales bacterium]|nr:hypothetical protein [Ktedonobacterales bacterium]